MCGIAGIIGSVDGPLVGNMLRSLGHRGPDGNGVKELERATLGHTRLSILDLAGGHQPMGADGAWITYNGEIYNYRELRRAYLPDLSMKGHSDTEVLLHLYKNMGPWMVDHLDGMFAFALYYKGDWFLARDPLGIKPLYYSETPYGMAFASEIKALGPLGFPIKEFPPGCSYHSGLGWRTYYDLRAGIRKFDGDQISAHELIRDTLAKAVSKRLLADVPVGVCLSGGLDSSIIAALANEETKHLHSFVVGMSGAEDLAAARCMADYLGNQHHERVFTEAEMIAHLPDVIHALETFDPALVRSSLPNYFLAELASDYVKVMLTGEGADELYGGYDYMSQYETATSLQAELLYTTDALHNTNLQRADRLSMVMGVEARVPFLDKTSVSLALGLPADWKLHQGRSPKHLLREAFRTRIPSAIVDRPKLKFSAGAGSADILRACSERLVSDQDLSREQQRLRKEWNYGLQNKEALYCYRILRERMEDSWIFPTLGQSRSL